MISIYIYLNIDAYYVNKHLIGLRCFIPSEFPLRVQSSWEQGLDVYPYTFLVSSVFTMATFVVHAILPELRNIHGVVIMCYLASMSATYVGFGIIQLHGSDLSDAICYYLGK